MGSRQALVDSSAPVSAMATWLVIANQAETKQRRAGSAGNLNLCPSEQSALG